MNNSRPREFWIADEDGLWCVSTSPIKALEHTEAIYHVIEYSAYQAQVTEMETYMQMYEQALATIEKYEAVFREILERCELSSGLKK